MTNPIQDTQTQGNVFIARLTGSLTAMNAPDLRVALFEAIKKNRPGVLALNLAEVDFIDSSALGVFVEARRKLADQDGEIAFTNVNKDVRGVMRMMRLDDLFNFTDDESDVLDGPA